MNNLDVKNYDSSNLSESIKNHGKDLRKAIEENEEIINFLSERILEYDNILISGCGDKYILPHLTQFLTDAYLNKSIRTIHSRVLANYTPEWIDEKALYQKVSRI